MMPNLFQKFQRDLRKTQPMSHTTLWASQWKLFYIIKLMDIWINIHRKESTGFVSLVFFKEKLCLTNLFDFSEGAIKNVDKRCPFDMVYLYFPKAFSNVPHSKTPK